ncbi:hypothetical protein [Eubacterium aggregans]|uniref:hypothetical protein n=1 Tax=Eubacterium aggregans TaxID=81409 RepID=UPI003F322632
MKPGFAKEKLGQARQFDSEQWQKLSALPIEKELKSVDEKYKVYDFKTGSWVDSNQSDFESLKGASDGPVVYGYEFTVKDSRREELAYDQDHSLEATAFGKLFIANMVYSSEDSNNYILAQDTVAKLSETQVAFLGEQGVKDEIKKQLGVKGITEKNGGEFELVDVNVAVNSNSLDYSNPQPKAYSCKLSIGSGDSNVATMLFKLIVTENSWSHNTVNQTEKDGASGFIVIPKSVELKRSEPGMLEASDEVFFADYPNATKVIYNLSVEKTFKLTKESDETNQIEVNTAADGATEGTNNQLNLGEINNTNGQGNAKPIHFSSTSNQINQSNGRWTGNVTFYLTRI